ncbi:MAG: hypothetical protein U9R38_05735 [Candidatus Margulisiibacteriota bacterium]|nr:hypothetical protein [Candidatus Margulisiibacteriota bacterium]
MRIGSRVPYGHAIHFKRPGPGPGEGRGNIPLKTTSAKPPGEAGIPQLKNDLLEELRSKKRYNNIEIEALERAFNLMVSHYGEKEADWKKTVINLLHVAKTLAAWGTDPLVVSAGLLHLMPVDELARENIDPRVVDLIKRKSILGSYLFIPLIGKISEREADYLLKMCLMQEGNRNVWLLEGACEFASLSTNSHTGTTASRAYHITSRILSLFDLDSISVLVEDISLLRLDKEEYQKIESIITAANKRSRLDALSRLRTVTGLVSEDLALKGIKHRIQIDVKSVPRTLKKIRKGKKLTDASRFRVIIEGAAEQCVKTMDVVTEDLTALGYYELTMGRNNFLHGVTITPGNNFGRKKNGYESIHLHFRGENYEPVNVQIRTEEMHAEAEAGSASHGRFKLNGLLGAPSIDEAGIIREKLIASGEKYGIHRGITYRLLPNDAGKKVKLLDLAFCVNPDLGLRCPEHVDVRRIDPKTGKRERLILKVSSPVENGDVVIIKKGNILSRNPNQASTASTSTALKLATRGVLDKQRIQQRTSEAAQEGEIAIETELSPWFRTLTESIHSALERDGKDPGKAKIYISSSLSHVAHARFGLEDEKGLFVYAGLAKDREQTLKKIVQGIKDASVASAYLVEERHTRLWMMVRDIPGVVSAIFLLINKQNLGIETFNIKQVTTNYSLAKITMRSRKKDFESEMRHILAGAKNIYSNITHRTKGIMRRKIEVLFSLNRCNAYVAHKISAMMAKNGANIVSAQMDKDESRAKMACSFTISVPIGSLDSYIRNLNRRIELLKKSIKWLRVSPLSIDKY